jgi:hypothetical protein
MERAVASTDTPLTGLDIDALEIRWQAAKRALAND